MRDSCRPRLLRVQEASLTGRSEAVLKNAATLPEPVAFGDRVNMVFKGTAVVQGTARRIVTAVGMQTEMGSIATMLEATGGDPTLCSRRSGGSGACSASR